MIVLKYCVVGSIIGVGIFPGDVFFNANPERKKQVNDDRRGDCYKCCIDEEQPNIGGSNS